MARFASSLVVLLALLPLATRPAGADEPPGTAPAATKPVDLENRICPVRHQPVAPGVTATVGGAIVHFCCTNCVAKYRADPAAYEAALRSDPEVARRLDLATSSARREPAADAPTAPAPSGAAGLHDAMRALWLDHVAWTRSFIVSATANLPDKDAATERLLRNQTDIGEAVKPYFGDEAATKLTTLLKDHIHHAAELVEASVAGDSAKAEAAKGRWTSNAGDIADFLSKANPTAWPLDTMKSMWQEHLDLTAAEATARIQKDWKADIDAYDKVRAQALRMADLLSDGIEHRAAQKAQ